jgi:hypothetical protein
VSRRRVARVSFVMFCRDVLDLVLTAPWLVLLKVAIDGVQPRELEGEERALARQLFGDVEEIDPRVRRVLVWRLGRGSGKTTIAAALCVYESWTANIDRAGPGQIPTSFLVGPSKPLARIGFTVSRELVRRSALERYVLDDADTRDGFLMRRPDGRVVAIRSVAASKGGANLRGVDVVVLVLDESEFFAGGDDGDYAITDRDQISAVMPRLIGYVLCISTPWPTDNVTSEYFESNVGKPSTALAALGASMLMRPSEQLADDREREMARDPENAAREYDCESGVRGGNRLFVEGLKEAVDESRPLSITAQEGAIIGCGGDLGLERDSSAIAIVGRLEDVYSLCEFDEVRPAKGQALAPGYVIRGRFAPVMRRHGAHSIVMDAHYRQSAIEHLTVVDLDLEDAPAGQQGKYDSHMFVRSLLRSGKLRLPNSPRLLGQMRAVTATPMPGGGTRISSPRRAGGGHGDVVSALVLSVWQAGGSPAGKRVRGLGLLRWYEREAAMLTGGPSPIVVAEAPEELIELVAPPRIASASTFSDISGKSYMLENGRIRARLRDIEDLRLLGFQHTNE